MDGTTLQFISIAVAVLFPGGVLAYFWNIGSDHKALLVRMALTEESAKDSKIKVEQLKTDQVRVETEVQMMGKTMEKIEASLSKLNQLDRVIASVEAMKERMEDQFAENRESIRDIRQSLRTPNKS